ncbi:MAG: prepilin-type N-terminal cleavage/methylation domain-containing protein [Gammaproteobacteria bacterium]
MPNNFGFTLLELLVTLLLLSFLVALGARFLSRPETSAALATMNKTLERMRFQAMRENRRVAVKCEDMIERLPGEQRVACYFNRLPTDAPEALAFFPDGSSNGGRIVWHHRDKTETLFIDWLTGTASYATR